VGIGITVANASVVGFFYDLSWGRGAPTYVCFLVTQVCLGTVAAMVANRLGVAQIGRLTPWIETIFSLRSLDADATALLFACMEVLVKLAVKVGGYFRGEGLGGCGIAHVDHCGAAGVQ